MPKKSKEEIRVILHPNGVAVRSYNSEISIIKRDTSKKKFVAKNGILVKSLTKDSGYNPGVISFLSENGKIKFSKIGFSDKSLRELHTALDIYLRGLEKGTINSKK